MGLLQAALTKSHPSDEPHLHDEGAEMDPLMPFLSLSHDSRPERRPWDFFTWPGLGVGSLGSCRWPLF